MVVVWAASTAELMPTPAPASVSGFLFILYVLLAVLGEPDSQRVSCLAGGRIDVRRQIEDFNVIASLTDNTVRNYDAAPWLKDALLTADKKISSALPGSVRTASGNGSVLVKALWGSSCGISCE